MKPFIAYPTDIEEILRPKLNKTTSGRLLAHYELYKHVRNLNGSIVKCGITSDEEVFKRFTVFRGLLKDNSRKIIAFEKQAPLFETIENDNADVAVVVKDTSTKTSIQQHLIETGIANNVAFIPGVLADSIPEFLIENPETKISFLNIDLEDYDSTLTTLDYLYPRLITGGVLVLDNYHKNGGEAIAVREYFKNNDDVFVRIYSQERGPYYIIKD